METSFTKKSLLFLIAVLQLALGVVFYKFFLMDEFWKWKYVDPAPRMKMNHGKNNVFRRAANLRLITMKGVNNTGDIRRLNTTVLNTTLGSHNQTMYDISPDYEDVFLLMMVTTTPDSFKRRHVIRTTWGGTQKQIRMKRTALFKGGNISTSIEMVFVVGISGDEDTDNKIQHEADKFGDILRISIKENYRNIVHKILAAYSWAITIKPRYILKADHDVYINVPRLQAWLLEPSIPQFLYSGAVHTGTRVSRNKKDPHYVSKDDLKIDIFPDYCAGPCYVLSQTFLSKLIAVSRELKVFEVEDAFMGVVADHLNIKPFKTNLFWWDRRLNSITNIRKIPDKDFSGLICLGDSLDIDIIDYLHFRYMQL